MSPTPGNIEEIAATVKVALESPDLEAFADLLDPRVHWGPPDDQVSGCHSRQEVLRWYRRGRAVGTRAQVSEVVVIDHRILVGLRVTQEPKPDQPAQSGQPDQPEHLRWQVLTVSDGQITDVAVFEDRVTAAAWAGIPSP